MKQSTPLSNTRREMFCQFIVAGSTEVDAYVKAGYSEKTAKGKAAYYRKAEDISNRIEYLLSKKVKALEKQNKTIHDQLGISKKWVLEKLMEVHALALAGDPIVNGDGAIVGYKPNLPSANKSLELIGKEMGMFAVKIETNTDDPLLTLIQRVQGHALLVAKEREKEVHDVIEGEDG